MFDGKVGASYSDSELSQVYETARKRFSDKIPPGFKDSEKPEPVRFGDYVGWRQILDFAVKNKVSVILITDDAKEDWWRREGSHTFGPRPELIVEFRNCCSGLFYMYSSYRFLEFSQKYFGGPVDPRAISELKERRESEPVAEAMKSIAADQSPLAAIKPTAYISDPSRDEEGNIPDTPKLTAQDIDKPEGE